MEAVQLSTELTLSASADDGKPRRFAMQAYNGGTLPVKGYDYPVVVDLSTLQEPPSMPILIDHQQDVESTLGSTDTIKNTGSEITIAGPVTATSVKAMDVVKQSDKGQRWQASIGVRPSPNAQDTFDIRPGRKVQYNGRTFEGPVTVLRNGQMFETSVLPAGADQTTSVNLAAMAATFSRKAAAMKTFEEFIAESGFEEATLSEEQRASLTSMFDMYQKQMAAPAVPPPAEPPAEAGQPEVPAMMEDEKSMEAVQAKMRDDMIAGMRKEMAAEAARVSKINELASDHPKIVQAGSDGGWDATKTELAVLKEEKKVQAPLSRGGIPTECKDTPQVLEAALCSARRLPEFEKDYSDQILQAAHNQFGRAGIGLQQLLVLAAASNGYAIRPGQRYQSDERGILRAAFGRGDVAASFSTVSLPGIMSNVANKELLAGYEGDEQYQLWREIAAVKSVSDFKTVTSYRLLDNMEYEQLGPAGKIKHGSLGEESYTRSVDTYAKMFSLTRRDIINDDLGALDDLRTRLGFGAAQKLSNIFWQEFLNATLFTTARGNYIEGSTTNLGTDGVGLQLGVNAFKTLRSPAADGSKRIGGTPQKLVVPTELSVNAEKTYRNQNFGGGTTVEEANIHYNKYQPVEVPWLSDSDFTNSSSTAWYLFGDTNRWAPMVVSFLNGQEQPTVESADADFDTLGVDFRGYHDFGVDEAEYLAGIQSKGAA